MSVCVCVWGREAEVNKSIYKNKDINVEPGDAKNGKQAEYREERW